VIIVTAVFIAVTLGVYLHLVYEASVAQHVQLTAFMDLVDSKTGRLKPEFYPPDAEMTIEEYKAMFAVDVGPKTMAMVSPA